MTETELIKRITDMRDENRRYKKEIADLENENRHLAASNCWNIKKTNCLTS